MNKIKHGLVILTLNLAAVGCNSGDVKDTLGLRKAAPDEFNVISNPPLYVPPEFDLVQPGTAPKAHENTAAPQPLEPKAQPLQKDEQGFLEWLDQARPADDVKKSIDEENLTNKKQAKEKGVIRKTVAKLSDSDHDTYVDPVKERDRIRNNMKENKPINDGTVPTKTTSTLEKLFQ